MHGFLASDFGIVWSLGILSFGIRHYAASVFWTLELRVKLALGVRMKGMLTYMGMNTFTLIALVISFTAFMAVLVWVFTRSQAEMDLQARLYEDDDRST